VPKRGDWVQVKGEDRRGCVAQILADVERVILCVLADHTWKPSEEIDWLNLEPTGVTVRDCRCT
jgi:hypothetical protein